MRETIPDEVLSAADEVVLIDLTPEALIARLRAGKVYRPERVPAALNNFFKIENLAALRETALRQVAEDVEVKRLVRERPLAVRRDEEGWPRRRGPAPQAIAERLLALATLDAALRARRAPRVALGAAPRRRARRAGRAPARAHRRAPRTASGWRRCAASTSMLGARLRVEEGEDVAAVAIERRARARQHLRADRRAAARAAASRACWPGADVAAHAACSRGCPASTCGSSPTRRCGARRRPIKTA